MSNCWKCGRELTFGIECEDGCQPNAGGSTIDPSSPGPHALALVVHTVEEMGAAGSRIPVTFKGEQYEVLVRKVAP